MATDAELLVEAERAFHELVTGVSARVVVDQNGERVEYTAANRAALQAYIQMLKNRIADSGGIYRVSGPAGVFF